MSFTFESLNEWVLTQKREIAQARSPLARFAKGTFWLLVGTVLTTGLQLLSAIFVARLLGKTIFGEFGMIISTVGALGVFAGLGLGMTVTKYIAEWRTYDPPKTGRIIGLSYLITVSASLAVGTTLFWAAPALAANTLNAPHLITELRLGCLLLFFNTVNGIQSGALSGVEAFRTITITNVVRGFLNLPVMLILVFYLGLPGAVSAAVLVALIGCLQNHIALRRECKARNISISYTGLSVELPMVWRFSIPAFLGGALVGPVFWAANAILAHQPGGYGEIGLISAANQWRIALMTLPAIFSSAAMPLLASFQESGTEKNNDFSSTAGFTLRITSLAIIPAYAVIIFLGDTIMSLYGKGFSDGYPVLVGTLFGISLSAFASVGGLSLAARGQMWIGLLFNLVWAVTFLSTVQLLVHPYGAIAYAAALSLSYIVLLALVFWHLRTILSPAILGRTALAVIFIIIITIGALALSPSNRLLLSAPVILVVSLISVQFFGRDIVNKLWLRTRRLAYHDPQNVE